MGILNITPDSFYADSRVPLIETAYKKAEQLLSEGATFLDIGGYSTRPNAEKVSEAEEIKRVLPVVEILSKKFPAAILSIDTFRSNVGKAAIEAGGHLINDISGGNIDPQMFETIAQLNIPYVMMHSRGDENNPTRPSTYENIAVEVIKELQSKVVKLRELGVKDIIIDPGFGFSKNIEQNYSLLQTLESLQILELPMLVGLSRKSMIWKFLEISPEDSLNGTAVMNTIALQKGASILRVHDVKAAMEVIKLITKIN